MTDRQLWLALQRRAAQMEPGLAREILAAYDELRKSLPQRELERLIREGRMDLLLSEHLTDETVREVFQKLRAEMQRSLRASMEYHFARLPQSIRPGIAFDILNPRIIEAARILENKALERLLPATREVFRETVIAGIEAGVNPRTVARNATDAIGLAPRNAAAVRAFRLELETGDRAALARALEKGTFRAEDGTMVHRAGHAGGQGLTAHEVELLERKLGREPLTPTQIDGLVAAYERRLRAWEAESYARSTALDAMRFGERASWEAAIAAGFVDRALVMKRRVVRLDGREREEHRELNGQAVHFDEPYANGEIVSGDDSYNCRCRDRYFLVASVEEVARITRETMPELPLAA